MPYSGFVQEPNCEEHADVRQVLRHRELQIAVEFVGKVLRIVTLRLPEKETLAYWLSLAAHCSGGYLVGMSRTTAPLLPRNQS